MDAAYDLSFVQHEVHRSLLHDIAGRAQADAEVTGAMVHGAVARREALPHSDLEVLLLMADGCRRTASPQVHRGILTEYRCMDRATALQRLAMHEREPYLFTEGRVLHDRHGHLAELRLAARQRLEAYAPAPERVRSTATGLTGARQKMVASLDGGDCSRAAYVASIASWQILEGVWLANGRPVPTGGAVWAHLADLADPPPEAWLRDLCLAEPRTRAEGAVRLISWVLERLGEAV